MSKKRTSPPRPRDLNQLASHIGKIATHQIEDEPAPPPASPEALKRARARTKSLSKARRAEIARDAANKRWDKKKGRS